MRAQVSARSGHRRFIGSIVAVVGAFCLWTLGESTLAHEHKHTHQNLARAAFRLLNSPFLETGRFPNLTRQDIENEIAQGVVDEDECLGLDDTDGGHNWGEKSNWNSHFYEAKTRERLDVNIVLGAGCEGLTWKTHTTAADRAQMLYAMAINDYQAGRIRSSFRILGRVMHLLQDMTSPAHVHNDPHGEIPFVAGCGGDTDDFERWGYCDTLAVELDEGFKNTRICEYFYDASHTNMVTFHSCSVPDVEECVVDFNSDGHDESYGVPPPGFSCRLWAALHRLYDGRPAGSRGSNNRVAIGATENAGIAFVHRVANVTYDFTTFTVWLDDDSESHDEQADSELKLMLRGGTPADCNNISGFDEGLCEWDRNVSDIGFVIRGTFQDIGFSYLEAGNAENQVGDDTEEWWIMPTSFFRDVETNIFGALTRVVTQGFAYIENSGGEGEHENGDQDSFIPDRYGCTAHENLLEWSPCSERGLGPKSKRMFQELYGGVNNRQDPFPAARVPGQFGKTMLRIYGDVLYTTAVAYGAGLIQTFIDDVTVPPTAAAGGPYEGEACTPIDFDASGSSDTNGNIGSYAWDFNDDGTFDATTPASNYSYAYPSSFEGRARLRVTDNDGFTDDSVVDVLARRDVTAPLITNISATPDRLAPPDGSMVPVTIDVLVTGGCNDATCQITGVTSSDPAGGQEPDWVTIAPLKVTLRAERSSAATDRIYTIALACTDAEGNQSTSEVTVIVARERRPPSKEMDFDLNGWADVLWHHQTNGKIATWLLPTMGGKHFAGRPTETDPNWKIVGSGDIDQDGYPDLVWQHATDGRLRFWGTNDVRTTIERPFSPDTVRDTRWKIKAVADFNQDGKPDLVWQHEADGRIAVWFMNQASVQTVGFLGPGQLTDLDWKIVGTGDFNRDGWADLVWQHQRDGRLAVWHMHGTAVVATGLISPGRIFDLDWRIRGIVDVNGDEMPDVLWQHGVTGDVAAWVMNGTTLMWAVRIGRMADTNWHIVGPR